MNSQFPRPMFSVRPFDGPEYAISGAETDMASFSHETNESGPELTKSKASSPSFPIRLSSSLQYPFISAETEATSFSYEMSESSPEITRRPTLSPKYSSSPFRSPQFALCNVETTVRLLPAQASPNVTRRNKRKKSEKTAAASDYTSFVESFPGVFSSFTEPPTPPTDLSLEDVKARFKSVLEPIQRQSHSLAFGATMPSAFPTTLGHQPAAKGNLFDQGATLPSTFLDSPRYPDFPDIFKSPEFSHFPEVPTFPATRSKTKATKSKKRRDKTKRSKKFLTLENSLISPLPNPIGLMYDHPDWEILPSEQRLADLCDDSASEMPDLGDIISDIEIEQAIADKKGSTQKKHKVSRKYAVRAKPSLMDENAFVAEPLMRPMQVGPSEYSQSASIQSATLYPNTRSRARALTISKVLAKSNPKPNSSTLDEVIEDAKLAAFKGKDWT